MPAAHDVQVEEADAPVMAENKPMPQPTQPTAAVVRVVDRYEPAAQLVHAPALVDENCPTAQLMQVVLDWELIKDE